VIGTVSFGSTGGWQTWVTRTVAITGVTGVKNLFMVFQGGAGIGNVNWIRFNAPGGRQAVPAENASLILQPEFRADMYPNPSSGENIKVRMNGGDHEKKAVITIFNAQGNVVMEKITDNAEEEFQFGSRLVKGLYFMQIKRGNEKELRRFIVDY
jgi:hypothetical protein